MSDSMRICVISDASRVDWALFSWMKPLAEQGIMFTVLARKLPQLPWLEKYQVTATSAGSVQAVSGDSISQLAQTSQLNGRSWDIFYFASVSAAITFTKQRAVNDRLIIRATNWDLTVAPHLRDGKRFQQQMVTLLAQANRVEVATEALRQTAVSFGIDPQKITVISPGVNLGYYKPLAQPLTISATAPLRLLAAISLEWADGFEYLLHTIRCCLDAGLPVTADVIGYGSGRQRLYYLLDDFQLFDVVQPTNHLPRPALREKYRQAHFLLQTNLTDDLNQQTFEAMACGLPPLAFAGPNWQELLADLAPSLLTPLRQPQAMADKLRHFAQNPSAYSSLWQRVHQLTAGRFGLGEQVAQFLALFTAVMQESPVGTVQYSVGSNQFSVNSEQPVLADPSLPHLAVATVAVGEAYARWALAMIESVQGNGRFQGPIYVVTDCANLFAAQENVHLLPVPQSDDPLVAKQYKTRLPEWVPFEQTLFVDADVVVGRPLLDWFTAVVPETSSYALFMFPDEGIFDEKYHTGVILMQQASAASLMGRWRAAIQSGQHKRDQAAFMAVAQPNEVCLMPNHHLLFPTIETFKRGHITTFNHITFTGRQRNFSPEIIHNYLQQSLHLAHLPMDE